MAGIDRPAVTTAAPQNPPFATAELGLHLLATFLLTARIVYLHTQAPVAYMRLISEDDFGEYATTVSYLVMAGFFALLIVQAGGKMRRLLWLLVALCAFFVGMEEISWGQRLFHLPTPEVLQEHNVQGELSLHNLIETDPLHMVAAWLIIAGIVASTALLLARQGPLVRFRQVLEHVGFPLIPIPLAPWFALTAYFFLTGSFVKGDEVGEFVLGLGVALFGLYTWLAWGALGNRSRLAIRVTSAVILLLLIALVTEALMRYGYEGGIGHRLRMSATRDYPALGMYQQADMIFAYLEANPRYLRDDTLVLQAHQLLARGKAADARPVLQRALARLEAENKPGDVTQLQLRGEILALMGRPSEAQQSLAEAEALDRARLEGARMAERPELLWSLGRTRALLGDLSGARRLGMQALEAHPTEKKAKKIRVWMESLANSESVAPPES
jgi:hypothetical protein